jgi:phage N-6-adenine-methyltransferase
MTTQLVLGDIRLDGGTQPRAELNEDVITDYATAMRDGVEFEPIIVFYDGTDYWLADGFHRVRAAQSINADTIAVDIRQGDRREAILHSVGANAKHGLQRTNADKRRAVETLLRDEEWSKWSDREIARRCLVHHQMVGKLRDELSLDDSSSERTYTTRHGTTGTMKTANIGKTLALDVGEERHARANARDANTPEGDGIASGSCCYTPGMQAYCKYCYSTHTAWVYGGYTVYEGSKEALWLCEHCQHKTADGSMDVTPAEEGVQTVQDNPGLADEPLTTYEGEVMQGRSTRAEHSRIVMTQSDSNEWYTPAHIIDLARETLGGIDLDPASCELANQTVQAERYYTEDDNGLSLPWNGRVWMNPPYGELAGKFVHRFVSEYQAGNIDAGIILVKAATDTAWFRPLFEYPICFIHGRVKFYTSETEGIATFPSVCIYLGEDEARFCDVFSTIGRVMKGVAL